MLLDKYTEHQRCINFNVRELWKEAVRLGRNQGNATFTSTHLTDLFYVITHLKKIVICTNFAVRVMLRFGIDVNDIDTKTIDEVDKIT